MSTLEERKAARRKALPGFPIEEPFESYEAAAAYLSGNKIQCLRCGKMYRVIGCHLAVHGMTLEEYREKYKLPWRAGICSATISDMFSKEMAFRRAKGWAPPTNPKIGEISKTFTRRKTPFKNEIAIKNLGAFVGPELNREVTMVDAPCHICGAACSRDSVFVAHYPEKVKCQSCCRVTVLEKIKADPVKLAHHKIKTKERNDRAVAKRKALRVKRRKP